MKIGEMELISKNPFACSYGGLHENTRDKKELDEAECLRLMALSGKDNAIEHDRSFVVYLEKYDVNMYFYLDNGDTWSEITIYKKGGFPHSKGAMVNYGYLFINFDKFPKFVEFVKNIIDGIGNLDDRLAPTGESYHNVRIRGDNQ